MKRFLALLSLLSFAFGCSSTRDSLLITPWQADVFDSPKFQQTVSALLSEHQAAGAGIGVIRDGAIVWRGYFGEQGPGEPASARTVFNTASVAKTITAETLIALAEEGLISLDEPVYNYVSHPDLSEDRSYQLLTPRLLLSHRAGLLNWPYEYENGRASFVAQPGTTFSYSGMGIELAAQYAEAKLGKDFEALAFEHVLEPMGIAEMSMGRIKPWLEGRLTTPMTAAGEYRSVGEVNPRLGPESAGIWTGADDLLTTVDAYLKLLTGLINETSKEKDLNFDRSHILTDLSGDAVWNCKSTEGVTCANRYGHGLGWMVYEFDKKTVLKHGGNDAGESALVIYSPETRDGSVIFVNGGNGIFVVTQVLALIGDEPEIAAYYRQLVNRFYDIDLPAIENEF